MVRYILGLGFSLLLAFAAIAEESEKRVVSPVDMVSMPRLSSAQLSPDGQYLLYKKSHTDWSENKIVRRFVLQDLATGDFLDAPNPRKESNSARSAWWSADSKSLLFLKRADDDAPVQLHRFNIATGESTKLTSHATSIIDVFPGEDDEYVFFSTQHDATLPDEPVLDDKWRIDAYDRPENHEIWRLDLTDETVTPVIFGNFSVRNVSVSADQNSLVYLRVPDHLLNNTSSGEVIVHDLTTGEDKRWTNNIYRESGPELSPSGDRIAYIATVNEAGEPYYEDKVFVQTADGDVQRLLGDMAMEANGFAWDKSGEGLYILGNTGLSTDLYYYHLQSEDLTQLTSGEHSVSAWRYDVDTGRHLIKMTTASSPGDYYQSDAPDEGFERLTNVSDDWAAQFHLPTQEAFTWKGRRGVTIEGVLVYPIGYQAGTKYPLVTITHGGPRSSSQYGSWNVSRYVSVLAGQGYLVFLPNHRGGTGYGDKFMRDMYGSYFRNAHHDVMDGIDALIEDGLADPDRLVKMGWSAGGHMVNKLITHTDRFKAASSGAGAADWLSMHGESDVRRSRTPVFGGEPWTRRIPRRQYTKDSPLKDAWKVTTPTLFFAGEKDVRVPPTQSILMHRGVLAAGVASEFYLGEDEPHNFRKPANQLFKINTELEWYARYVLKQTYVPDLPGAAFETEEEEAPETADDGAEISADRPK